MSTRRRIGISTATTEAARRQLMQPVPCWEKVWAPLPDAPAGTSLKVYKWVKTDKKQNFSDDEEEPDLPLAPLPELEQEADEDMEQDDQATSAAPDSASRAVSEPAVAPQEQEESTPAPPKRHPLSMSLVPDSPTPTPEIDDSALNAGLASLDPAVNDTEGMDEVPGTSLQVPLELSSEMNADLDMSQLGPDGEPFESADNLAQLQATDTLLGAEAMDQSSDPFGPAEIPQ